MLYPQRNPSSYPSTVENGFNTGPPPTFGNQSLPPLVEHQEEAMFEQIQEMIDSAPTPPPTPPPSPHVPSLSSSHHSSHPVSPNAISPSNHLSDDKETLEREILELTLMVATKPRGDLEESDLSFGSEDEGLVPDMDEEKDMNIMSIGEKQLATLYTEDIATVRSNDISTAIKIDTFRVEESSSPLPLSPITEVSSDGEVQRAQEDPFSPVHHASLPVTPPPPLPELTEDPEDTLDKELNELMKFSGMTAMKTKLPTTPPYDKRARPLSDIVTPPPMFDSPPPPKPTSAAPKRVVKRPAPPPPKPKPKHQETASPVPASQEPTSPSPRQQSPSPPQQEPASPSPTQQEPASPSPPPQLEETKEEEAEVVEESALTPPLASSTSHELFQPIQRPESPDLLAQMQQELASSKRDSNFTKPLENPTYNAQPERKKNAPYDYNYPRQPARPLRAGPDADSQTPLEKATALLPQNVQSPPPNTLPLSSPSSGGQQTQDTRTPGLMEVVGDIKIHRVVKTRWTPKSSSTEPSPAQTPENQPTPTHYPYKDRSATLPNVYRQQNGISPASVGGDDKTNGKPAFGMSSVVVARGIGSGRGIGIASNPNRASQPVPATYQHYQQQQANGRQPPLNSKPAQPWKSQEELRIHQIKPGLTHQHQQPQARVQRLPSAPADYKVQKSRSLPRGTMEDWKQNRSKTWVATGGRGRTKDGVQAAYLIQANSPYDLCSRCHQPLGQGAIVTIPSVKTQYHTKCFVCRVCRSSLSTGGQSTTVMIKGMQPHCPYCVSSDNGKIFQLAHLRTPMPSGLPNLSIAPRAPRALRTFHTLEPVVYNSS